MIEIIEQTLSLVTSATFETLIMVFLSMFFGIAFGIPIALGLYITRHHSFAPSPVLNSLVNFLINALRSIPYIILAVLMMPMTRFLVGSSIGLMAAIVPLTLAASLLVARATEDALATVPHSLIEVGIAMGAKRRHIITKILLPEALWAIVSGCTTVTINIIGFSAMAGTVGGGGLGDLAIRYGYQRYDLILMFIIVVILIFFVQVVQKFGCWLSYRIKK